MAISTKSLLLLLGFLLVGASACSAADKLWVGLYLAENGEPAPGTKLAPEKMHHRLHEVFGFNYYELKKSQEIDLHREWEHWFVPRKDFFLRVEPLHHQPGEPHSVDYEIYKDGFIVAKGKYEPHEATPLFINGPDFKQGRLILVLEAK